MKTIDNIQRKRLFGLAKAAHECSGSNLPLNEWRHRQQEVLGIKSLSDCPAELGLKLANRFHQICGKKTGCERTNTGLVKKAVRKKGPAGGRPKGILEWTGEQYDQMRKVEALLTDMELPWDYADSIAKKMFGDSVLRVDTLNKMQMRSVIAALVKRQQNHGGRRTEVRNG